MIKMFLTFRNEEEGKEKNGDGVDGEEGEEEEE